MSATSERIVSDAEPAAMSAQPGGGFCYQVEQAWGRWRRWYLKRLRPGYVRRMAALRTGDVSGAPHEIIDPRDLKYCFHRCTAHWRPEHNPFAWRARLPIVGWGAAELVILGGPLLIVMVLLVWLGGPWRLAAIVPAVLLGFLVYFFRDPSRRVPDEAGAIVAPADGMVDDLTPLAHDDFLGGPAVRIGIFLSIFNVHINRAPRTARVVDVHYQPGEYLNAISPASSERNEFMWIGFQEPEEPRRRLAVRQIAGLVARRIVCALAPGQAVTRGAKFGMIKFGSRTELILPAGEVEIVAKPGDRVRAGSHVVAYWSPLPPGEG